MEDLLALFAAGVGLLIIGGVGAFISQPNSGARFLFEIMLILGMILASGTGTELSHQHTTPGTTTQP